MLIFLYQICLAAVSGILKAQKRKHKQLDNDPLQFPTTNGSTKRWHIYDSKTLPDTLEKWNATTFIEKTHWGYFSWPK